MDALLKILKDNPVTLKEIGWDLPKGLLQFFSRKNINVNIHLVFSPLVSSVMECFNELAINGNPKECLLTACELVSTLHIVLTETGDSDEENEDLNDSIEMMRQTLLMSCQLSLRRLGSIWPIIQ